MKLRNYTSEVSAFQSQGDIERMLVSFGAQKIAKLYENGKTAGMLFEIMSEKGARSVRIPARVNDAANVLRDQYPTWNKERLSAQAERTAWKLMYEWVHIQLSMIQMGQAQPLEVFLPYLYDERANKTVFQMLEANNFKMLPAPE